MAAAAIAAGMLLAGVLVHVSPDVPDGWEFIAFMEEASAHVLPIFDLSQVGDIGDTGSTQLQGARDIATATIRGKQYAFVVSHNDGGIQALNLTNPANPEDVGRLEDTGSIELRGSRSIVTYSHNNHHYAAVAAYTDNGVAIVRITNPASMDERDSINDNSTLRLRGASGIDYYTYDSKRYVVVAGYLDNGVQLLEVTDPDNILMKGRIADDGSTLLERPRDVKAYTVDGLPYAAVTSLNEDGVQILNLTNPDNIDDMGSIEDGSSLLLGEANYIRLFPVGGSIYAAVTSQSENGIQILDISNPDNIVAAGSLEDDSSTLLDNPRDLDIFATVSGRNIMYYAAVASHEEDGVQIVDISDPSNPVPAGHFEDTSGAGGTRLEDANSVGAYVHSGSQYLAVAGSGEDGVQMLGIAASTQTNTAPEVDAGPDRTIYEGVTIYMEPSISDEDDRDQITYGWTATGGTFSDTTIENPYYTAPGVSSDTSYTLTLVAIDHHSASHSDTVTIRVLNDDAGIKPEVVGSIADGPAPLGGTTIVKVVERGGIPYALTAASDNDTLTAISLADPANPAHADNVGGITSAYGLDIFDVSGVPWAVVIGDGSINTLSLDDPANLPTVNTLSHANATDHVATFERSGTTYAAVISFANGALQVFSLASPASPSSVGSASTNSTAPDGIDTFTAAGVPYAAITSSLDACMEIHSLSNLASPSLVSTLGHDSDGCPFSGVRGPTTFEHSRSPYGMVSLPFSGTFQMINLAAPASPTLPGNFTDFGVLFGINYIDTFQWSGTRWAAASSSSGDVYVFDISDPARPAFAGNITGAAPSVSSLDGIDTFSRDGNVYAAIGSNFGGGIHVVQLTDNNEPIARAGPDQDVTAGATVTLAGSGSDSDRDSITYLWTHNSTITLNDPTITGPQFTISNSADNSTIRFTLTVTDEHGATDSDDMLVKITAKSGPTVNAGPDQVVNEGDRVTLSGSATSPDSYTLTSYRWEYSADPSAPTITLSPDNTLSTTFTAPQVTTNTTYTFLLTVGDSNGGFGDDNMNVLVVDVPSPAPIVNAGDNQIVNEGDTVTLTATAHEPDGESMTFSWSCRDGEGNSIRLGDTNSLSISFTAPDVGYDGASYTCKFTATDPHGSKGTDSLVLTVRHVPDYDGPRISMIGDARPTVVVGSSYVDPGATCTTIRDSSISLPVRTTGSVNTDVVGTYEIKYTCEYAGLSFTHVRTVKVIQSSHDKDPKITITYKRGAIGSDALNVDYSGDAVCRDREDGDISHKITTSGTHHTNDRDYARITYSCTDSGGNTVTASQKVAIIDDNSPPTISVHGDSIHINVGDSWSDPGATCHDREDGTWTIKAFKNTIDNTTPGHYLMLYHCIDSDGDMQLNGGVRHVYVTRNDLPPTLTLSSYQTTISVNGTWSMPTPTCIDKKDGNISALVTTYGENKVNVHKPGTYTVSFTCEDTAGNFKKKFFDVVVTE